MKNKVAIIIAIIVGLISIIAIKMYISGSIGAGQGGMVKVLAAKRTLKAGTMLAPSDCDTLEIPTWVYNKSPRSFVRDIEIGNYTKSKLTGGYKAGECISPLTFTTDVAPESLPVEPGMRAVTINVDDVSGVANNLKPNDHVDMVMVQRLVGPGAWTQGGGGGGGRGAGTGGGSSFSGQPILLNVFRNVRILIPGQRITTYEAENVGRQSYSTVTVELPVDKATTLAAERQFSQITLLLRAPNDTEGEDIFGVKCDSADVQDMIASIHKKDAAGGTPEEGTPPSTEPSDGSSPAPTPSPGPSGGAPSGPTP